MTHQTREFDGIICLGGQDWWYHNRGHFDVQLMRHLAKDVPVLFVNSIGVRMPNPMKDRNFSRRIGRKLKSLARGLVEAEPGFWVMSPAVVPGAIGHRASFWALAPQIRLAARRAGISRPLLWMHCPAAAPLAGQIAAVATVLQRTDRFEAFPDADAQTVAGQLEMLFSASDLTVYCAEHLAAAEMDLSRAQVVVTHGVDLERFEAAAHAVALDVAGAVPGDVRDISGPRVGFIGGIDHHTFDPELFLAVADRCRDAQFVLVGACSLGEGWTGGRSNIHLLGRRPYDDIAGYMAAMDVLIMPWNRSPWIEACNPVKLKEYLAVRRPVVTTPFPALGPWADAVAIAETPDEFAAAVMGAVGRAGPDLHNRLIHETWDRKADELFARLCALPAPAHAPNSKRAVMRPPATATAC